MPYQMKIDTYNFNNYKKKKPYAYATRGTRQRKKHYSRPQNSVTTIQREREEINPTAAFIARQRNLEWAREAEERKRKQELHRLTMWEARNTGKLDDYTNTIQGKTWREQLKTMPEGKVILRKPITFANDNGKLKIRMQKPITAEAPRIMTRIRGLANKEETQGIKMYRKEVEQKTKGIETIPEDKAEQLLATGQITPWAYQKNQENLAKIQEIKDAALWKANEHIKKKKKQFKDFQDNFRPKHKSLKWNKLSGKTISKHGLGIWS